MPVTVVNLDTAADVLRAELDENTRAAVLAPAQPKGGRGKTAPKLGDVSDSRTAKVAAIGTGYSGSTLDKCRHQLTGRLSTNVGTNSSDLIGADEWTPAYHCHVKLQTRNRYR